MFKFLMNIYKSIGIIKKLIKVTAVLMSIGIAVLGAFQFLYPIYVEHSDN